VTREELDAFMREIADLSADRLAKIEEIDRLTIEVSEMQARLFAMLDQSSKAIADLELQGVA
jgi:hypothetical protein